MAGHPSPHSALGKEICDLVESGSLEEVARWFAAHPYSVNLHNSRYQTPLMVAAQAPACLPVLRYLLSIGASPHYTVGGELEMTALHYAAAGGNVYGVALLLAAGADPLRLDSVGRSPLHCGATAAREGNAIVRRLLRAILHRVTVVALAWDESGGLSGPPLGVPGMGLGECPPGGPAAAAGALMASVTYISRSIAASKESLQSVLTTLAMGAHMGQPPELGGARGPGGSGGPSAFSLAGAARPCGGGGSSSAALAAAQGGSALARPQPTPAQRALAMAELHSAVADAVTSYINGQDDSGYTGLMLAAEYGHEDVVKTLIAAGCNVLARNKLQHTAIGVRFFFSGCQPRAP